MLSSLLLDNHAGSPITYNVVGSTAKGAEYRVPEQSLAEPTSVMFTFNIGGPQSKANDRLVISARNVVLDETTGLACVGTARLEVSVPRAGSWPADATQDLLATIGAILSESAWRDEIASAAVPNTAQA